jgi:hypothetical protein
MPRGRPKLERPEIDLGTPELQRKRMKNLTAETLDQLLEHDVITQDQHWCAIHFRWLYTLRYGSPSPHITDFIDSRRSNPMDNPEWRCAREAEYHEAASLLHRAGVLDEMLEVLLYAPTMPLKQSVPMVPKLREGLDILGKLWCNGAIKQI